MVQNKRIKKPALIVKHSVSVAFLVAIYDRVFGLVLTNTQYMFTTDLYRNFTSLLC